MVITRKDIETKEIEIPGFREILKNSKHPDYKELRIYIKNGYIPVDPEDDERELQKAKKRKLNAKKNKERRPSYEKMEEKIKKLNNQQMLDEFNNKKKTKNNYNNVLKWYNEKVKGIQTGADKTEENEEEIKNEKTGATGDDTTILESIEETENKEAGADTTLPDTKKGAKGKGK